MCLVLFDIWLYSFISWIFITRLKTVWMKLILTICILRLRKYLEIFQKYRNRKRKSEENVFSESIQNIAKRFLKQNLISKYYPAENFIRKLENTNKSYFFFASKISRNYVSYFQNSITFLLLLYFYHFFLWVSPLLF